MRAMTALGLVAAIGCGGAQQAAPEPPPAVEQQQPVAPAAEADGVEESAEVGSHLVARNFTVAPGKFAEVNLDVAAGVEVTAAFRSDAPVAWNVHSHPEGGVAVHQEGTGSEGKISFVAATAGGYSCLWVNQGDADVGLVVSVELPQGARVVSWHPEEP